jgi:hypothetical protein
MTTTVLQHWPGPRASGHVLKYNWFLGVGGGGGRGANTYGTVHKKNTLHQQQPGLGLKRNPVMDVTENGQDTGKETADGS